MSRRRSEPTHELPDSQRLKCLRHMQLGSYEVTAPLARGGTSSVFLAKHIGTGEDVALKVLDPIFADKCEVVDRLFLERTISQRVQHASLLDVKLADRSVTGMPYLVMELLEGENLGALADRGKIELDAIIAIGAQIAGALGALHAVNVAHCDVKADNIIVTYQQSYGGFPRVKVIDYGVATLLDQPRNEDDASIAGTPSMMAPEQWRGGPVAKSDVYGLGCLLFELITGDTPFHGTLPQLMQAHSEQLPERVATLRSDVPDALDRLVARALSKDPAFRPTMIEVESELTRLMLSRMNAPAAAVG